MKDIFTNLYNKVIGFFQADKGDASKVIASNRLKLVLMHDRTNLDTLTMQKMREQLIKVISRYIEIDQEALDLNLEGEGDAIALMLNIPVIRARTPEEIEEIEKAEAEEQPQEEAEEDVKEETDIDAENPVESEDDTTVEVSEPEENEESENSCEQEEAQEETEQETSKEKSKKK